MIEGGRRSVEGCRLVVQGRVLLGLWGSASVVVSCLFLVRVLRAELGKDVGFCEGAPGLCEAKVRSDVGHCHEHIADKLLEQRLQASGLQCKQGRRYSS